MSTKEYGCFFCLGKAREPESRCDKCGRDVDVSDELSRAKFNSYEVQEVLGRGFNGWMLKVEDEFQAFDMKVIPVHRLKEDSLPDKEARALAECSPHRNIAKFWRQLRTHINVGGSKVEVLCLLFEHVTTARPLAEVVADDSLKLSRTDVVDIAAGIASGLARMHSRGLWHNDLHDDNVLVRNVEPDENLSERYEAKLIDFGSTRPHERGEQETELSDYVYLSKHIYNLVLRFELGNQLGLTPADRAFAACLRRVAHCLADKDVSRRSMEPADVEKLVRRALEQCVTGHDYPSFDEMKKESRISFTEPLENTNALNLAPQDIGILFEDSLGWRQRIEKSEPVFIVGPRGCGKTMLLRYLSIASRARPQKEETVEQVGERVDRMRYIAFLVNMGQVKTPFIRSAFRKLAESDSFLAEDFCREFLNTHFAFEVLRTCVWLNSEKLTELNPDDLNLLTAAVRELTTRLAVRESAGLEELAEALDRRAKELSNLSTTTGYEPTDLCRDDVLARLAQCVRRTSWGRRKEVWFLLDDYSVTVLPGIVQRAYNQVLFRLSSEVRIKASSEGDGPILSDSLGRKYREGRELTKVNLGAVYFQAKEEEGRAFFEKILEARFNATGKGSLTQLHNLLGEHDHERSFGEYVRSLKRPGDARFHGFGLLCGLCSGDVSFIIELLHALTKGSWNERRKPLTAKEQDDIIKRFAHGQLSELHAASGQGEKLHEFAVRLGNLIKKYLLKSKGKHADERLRIEIEGTGELSQQAQEMQDVILRHSVLIYGGAGKSKKGLPTRKFYFRRLFAPCFPFSPSRKGCIPLSIQDYEGWLLDPNQIWEEPRTDPELPYK